jgi:integrase
MGRKRGNGEGTVYQRGDGRWAAQVTAGLTPDGRAKRHTVYGDTRREVVTKLDEIRQRAREGTLDQSNMRLNEALDFWLLGIKSKLSTSSLKRYMEDVTEVKRYLGKMEVRKINPYHVQGFYVQMERDRRPGSIRRLAGIRLRQALRQAVNLGIITTNPATQVPLPTSPPKPIHPLAPEQVTALLWAVRTHKKLVIRREYPLFLTALDSGARQGELFALEWSDYDTIRNEIIINKTLENVKGKQTVKEPKTAASRRRVGLTETTKAALWDWKAIRVAEDKDGLLMFPASRGGHHRAENFRKQVLYPACAAAGLPRIRFHDLRHTCATLLLLANVHPKVVQERLGHSKIQITLDTYSHVLPLAHTQAVTALDRHLRG